ncbi:putative DUF222 domain-containing protein [Pseudomonas brassicacearum]
MRLKRSISGDMAGFSEVRRQSQTIEQAGIAQMNETGADVSDMNPRLAFVVAAPEMAVLAEALRVGRAQRHRLETQAMEAVDQADVASERNPLQTAHGQQISDRDDAQPGAARVAGGQIANLDDAGAVHRTVSGGTDQGLDGAVQIMFEKQRPLGGPAHASGCAERAVDIIEPEQLRHEMTNVGAVDLAKTLLDERFELISSRLSRQSPVQVANRRAGIAKGQRQVDVPVEIGHGSTFSLGLLGESIEVVS